MWEEGGNSVYGGDEARTQRVRGSEASADSMLYSTAQHRSQPGRSLKSPTPALVGMAALQCTALRCNAMQCIALCPKPTLTSSSRLLRSSMAPRCLSRTPCSCASWSFTPASCKQLLAMGEYQGFNYGWVTGILLLYAKQKTKQVTEAAAAAAAGIINAAQAPTAALVTSVGQVCAPLRLGPQ